MLLLAAFRCKCTWMASCQTRIKMFGISVSPGWKTLWLSQFLGFQLSQILLQPRSVVTAGHGPTSFVALWPRSAAKNDT